MNHAIAARQATRLFWSVVGSSLLVVSGVTLAWLLGRRHDLPMTVFEACVMMMRHFRGMAYHQVDGLSVTPLLGLVFLVSGVWAGGRHLTAWRRTRHFLTRSEPYRSGPFPALDAALTTLPMVPQRLRTLATAHPVACTVGLWRPRIVLSAGLITDLSLAELAAVLSHEWGHVSRHDPLRIALLRLCSDALWFLPIVRMLARDSARVMEDAADDVAVVLTHQPLDLAAALVKTAKAQARPRWSPVPAFGGERMVTERVERLLEVVSSRPPQRHTRAWAASAVVATCFLGLLILPSQPAVEAVPTPPFALQPSMMACPMPIQQT